MHTFDSAVFYFQKKKCTVTGIYTVGTIFRVVAIITVESRPFLEHLKLFFLIFFFA
jgi:hypothetical protein